jgi:hypothetical protein
MKDTYMHSLAIFNAEAARPVSTRRPQKEQFLAGLFDKVNQDFSTKHPIPFGATFV